MATIIPAPGGGGGGAGLQADRVEYVDADGNADHTTIADAITAINAYGTAPSSAAPAGIKIIDAGTYDENFTLPDFVHLDGPMATIDGTITMGQGNTVNIYRHAQTAAERMVALSDTSSTAVEPNRYRASHIASGSNTLSFLAVTSTSELGALIAEIGSARMYALAPFLVDVDASTCGSGRLDVDIRVGRIESNISFSGHVFVDVNDTTAPSNTVGAHINVDIGIIAQDSSIESTGGLFQIDGGTTTIRIGQLRWPPGASATETKIWSVGANGELFGRIDLVDGWTTANTSTGTVDVKIGNEPTTWDHPDIGLPAHCFNMDEASGNLADSVGALAMSAVGTTADLTYEVPALGPGVGRRKGIHHSRASGAAFETTTSVGSAVTGDFTIAFVVNHRDTDTVSTTPILALYDSTAARSAGHINIHTTTGTTTDHLSVSVDGSVGASSPLRSPINWRWGNSPVLIAIRRSSTTMTLWIDGVQIDSATVTATDYSGLTMGLWRINATDASTYGQPCTITTVGIWNDDLTDAAMAAMIAEDGTIRIGAA